MDILVAEDNLANQLVLQTLLRRNGHKVTLAMNGQNAIDLALNKKYDMILMDIEMPHMDGIEATQHIRNSNSYNLNTLIVAVTAHGSPAEKFTYKQSGIDHVLLKPFRVDALNAVIDHFKTEPSSTLAPQDAFQTAETGLIDQDIFSDLMVREDNEKLKALLKSFWLTAYGLTEDISHAITSVSYPKQAEAARRLAKSAKTLGFTTIHHMACMIEHSRRGDTEKLVDELDDALLRTRKASNDILKALG